MAAVTRRQYKGAAASTTTTNGLGVSDTSVTLTATTGWPSSAGVPFIVVIDPGTSAEEKCSATISGSTLTLTRAQDDTTAAVHAAGATIYPVFSADEADEANKLASTLTTRGDLLTMNSGPDFARIAIGAANTFLKSDGSDATWAISPETDLITTKGDLLVGTAADTLARQGVGSNGQVLVADSGQTNGIAWVDPLTNRNMVINGAMQVAQRGTSTAGITTGGYYTADRWYINPLTLGTWTESVENDAPTGSGFRKSLKLLCTTADASPAAADQMYAEQQFEGQNVQQFLKGTASAKQFSVSFWVKSNVTGTYIAMLYDNNNTRHVCASYTVSVSGTWEKKTITFPADTTGALNNDNASSLFMRFWLGVGSNTSSGTLATTWASYTAANAAVGQTNLAAATNNYWQITGVQLEAGAVATPFEFEDYGITLTKCQRYYCRVIAAYLGVGLAYSTTSTSNYVNFPTTMRVAPSAVETTGTAANYLQVLSNTGTQTCNAVPGFVRASSDTAEVTATSASTGLVQGNATFLLASGGTPYLGFSAEL